MTGETSVGRVETALAVLGIRVAESTGDRLVARCPYHHPDNNPSWCIRITRHRYGQHVCRACGSGGTLIDLVMHVRKCDYPAAKDFLGEVEDAPLPPEPVPVSLELAIIGPGRKFRLPTEVVIEPYLGCWVTPARRYMEKRGVTESQVERWKLGYAVEGWLEGRVVIPTWAHLDHWKVEARSYMARDFSGDPARPRYRYPRGAENPDLNTMFGEMHWPRASSGRDVVVVVEGAFNALAVERALPGVPVAALGGSFLRSMHLLKLASFDRVVLLTDSDPAGDKAAAGITASLSRHADDVRRVRLPCGLDANDAPKEMLEMTLWPEVERTRGDG